MSYFAVYRTDFAGPYVAPEYVATYTNLERAQAKADEMNSKGKVGQRYQIFELSPVLTETACKHGFNFKHYNFAILSGTGEWCSPE